MKNPTNVFKQALQNNQPQIGLWLGLADPYCAEILAGTGFDWLLIDGEHAPNDVRSTLSQLQAVAPYPAHAVVRIPVGAGHIGTTLVKQYLDIGAQTLLVPMVDTAEEALAIVRASRYPPQGIRGMGSALARASRWQTYPDYVHEANDQVCVLVQVETATSMRNIDAIAATEGVDGVFIGPADLSASMGYPGNAAHPDVQAAIEVGIGRILRAGKAPGILATTEASARKWLDAGALFVAVGVDTMLLKTAAIQLRGQFKS